VLAQGVDTLVLGCTHYPLLKPLLQQVAGADMALVDSAQSMAERTAALLAERGLANTSRAAPRYEFYVTDVPLRFQTIGERFLGRTLTNVHVVKLD
jgi:glutamate racemase